MRSFLQFWLLVILCSPSNLAYFSESQICSNLMPSISSIHKSVLYFYLLGEVSQESQMCDHIATLLQSSCKNLKLSLPSQQRLYLLVRSFEASQLLNFYLLYPNPHFYQLYEQVSCEILSIFDSNNLFDRQMRFKFLKDFPSLSFNFHTQHYYACFRSHFTDLNYGICSMASFILRKQILCCYLGLFGRVIFNQYFESQ